MRANRTSFIPVESFAFVCVAFYSASAHAQNQPKELPVASPVSAATHPEQEQPVAGAVETEADKAPPAQDTEELTQNVARLTEAVERLEQRLAEREEAPVAADEPEAHKKRVFGDRAFYVGGTLGVAHRSRNNVTTLFGDVDAGDRTTFKIEGVFGRVLVEDAFAIGMVLDYEWSNDDRTTSDGTDQRSRNYTLRGGPALRQFVPLGMGGKVYAYYQASFVVGGTESVRRTVSSASSSVIVEDGFSMGLQLQPGIAVAATDSFAIELGVDVLGLDYVHTRTKTDYDDVGATNVASLNVDVNLLSLQFAFVGYW